MSVICDCWEDRQLPVRLLHNRARWAQFVVVSSPVPHVAVRLVCPHGVALDHVVYVGGLDWDWAIEFVERRAAG